MRLFGKKPPSPIPYDPAVQEPALRSSICTGEMVVGFLDRETGRFREYELARTRWTSSASAWASRPSSCGVSIEARAMTQLERIARYELSELRQICFVRYDSRETQSVNCLK